MCGPWHVEVNKILEKLEMLPKIERCIAQRKIDDTTYFASQRQPGKELGGNVRPLVIVHVLSTLKFAHLAASFKVRKAEC